MLQSHDPMVKWLRLKKKKFTRSLFHSKKREEKNKLQRCKLALAYPKFIAALSVFFFQNQAFQLSLVSYQTDSPLIFTQGLFERLNVLLENDN